MLGKATIVVLHKMFEVVTDSDRDWPRKSASPVGKRVGKAQVK